METSKSSEKEEDEEHVLVRKEVGRLGEESSILFLSGYLLKINFTLDLFFISKNAEIYEPASDET